MDVLDYIYLGKENPQEAEAFSPLIPRQLLEEVKSGELMAIGSMLLNHPNGALVFEPEGEKIVIRSIYVDAFDRRNGTGTGLIAKLSELAKEMGDIYSLDMRIPADCHDNSLSFLRSSGFDLTISGGNEIFAKLSDLERIDLPAPKMTVYTGEELDETILKSFETRLRKEGLYMLDGSLTEPPVIREISAYALEKGQVAAACVIAKEEKQLSLAYLYGSGGTALSSVLYMSRALALQSFDRDTIVFIDAVTESGSRLASRLLNGDMITTKKHAVKSL
ncbi:MAG: GNAT family N-acetyltransferase [Clostridiales bacterium]|nr:GNAT family N-acetyltransferase [Clostridiales bacterium]